MSSTVAEDLNELDHGGPAGDQEEARKETQHHWKDHLCAQLGSDLTNAEPLCANLGYSVAVKDELAISGQSLLRFS